MNLEIKDELKNKEQINWFINSSEAKSEPCRAIVNCKFLVNGYYQFIYNLILICIIIKYMLTFFNKIKKLNK